MDMFTVFAYWYTIGLFITGCIVLIDNLYLSNDEHYVVKISDVLLLVTIIPAFWPFLLIIVTTEVVKKFFKNRPLRIASRTKKIMSTVLYERGPRV